MELSWDSTFGQPAKGMGAVEHAVVETLWMMIPIWFAVMVGLILGWSWKPKWVTLVVMALRTRPRLAWSVPPGFGARRLWIAATAASAAPAVREALAALRNWFNELKRGWQDMHAKLQAIRPEEVAACFPAGRLTERARKLLFQESKASLTPDSAALVRRPSTPAADRLTMTPGTELPIPALTLSASGNAYLSFDAPVARRLASRPASISTTPALGPLVRPQAPQDSSPAASLLSEPSTLVISPGTSASGSPRSSAGDDGCQACSHDEVLTEEDLEAFMVKTEESLDGSNTGNSPWSVLMEKKMERMTYVAWRRDPQNGPTEYRSRTVVEDCSPETMRDFFWDDDFRPEWDGMLAQWRTLEECPSTGLQIVHWVRKFPLFCKDREYVIGRRIWSDGNTYYCLTKGLAHHPDVPRKDKPRRVDHFYSSWRIRGLEGGACEVLLFHQEDMGIQRDVAKMGVRQGMWGAVKKIEPGVRSFRKALESNPVHLSRSLSMARLPRPIAPEALTPANGRQKWGSRKCVSFFDLRHVDDALATSSPDVVPASDTEDETSARHVVQQFEETSGAPLVFQEQSSSNKESSSHEEPSSSGGGAADVSADMSQAEVARVASKQLVVHPEAGSDEQSPAENKQRRGRGLPLVVAASAVAFVCGLETGLLFKLLLAGAVRQAVCSGRQRKGGRRQ